jgi:hypothetical protein
LELALLGQRISVDRQIVSNERRWGRGFGDHPLTGNDLDETATYVAETQQPGYGPRHFAWTQGYDIGPDRIFLPEGHDATGHPNRDGVDARMMDEDFPTAISSPRQVSVDLRSVFKARGWKIDQHGRPGNPHGEQLVGDERIGLNPGIGFGHFLGEWAVVDVVLTDGDAVLLTTRSSGGAVISSLVGGYSTTTDFGFTPEQWRVGNRPLTKIGLANAARRILNQKAGVQLPSSVTCEIVWAIRPTSSPHTWNFWTATYTIRIVLPHAASRQIRPSAGTRFVRLSNLDAATRDMWPDHKRPAGRRGLDDQSIHPCMPCSTGVSMIFLPRILSWTAFNRVPRRIDDIV